MTDHKIVDGKIVPNEPAQFEYGERYVQCVWCKCKRPVKTLVVDGTGQPVCRSSESCYRVREETE